MLIVRDWIIINMKNVKSIQKKYEDYEIGKETIERYSIEILSIEQSRNMFYFKDEKERDHAFNLIIESYNLGYKICDLPPQEIIYV